MSTRRPKRTAHATEKMKRDALIQAAANQGTPILCSWCKKPIMPGQRYAIDHGHAVGRQGPNTLANLFPIHDAKTGDFSCHTLKTAHPRGPHTAIGGDTFEAAKTDRLEAMTKQDHAVLHGLAERSHSRMRSRGSILVRVNSWPAKGSRKLRSRPLRSNR